MRVRRDHYALPGTADHAVRAIRIGGRLACTSALYLAGVFELDHSFPHVHMPPRSARLRSPGNRRVPLNQMNRDGAELHWWPLLDSADGSEFAVGLRDAAAQVVRCQPPWIAVATLDNALHLGRLFEPDLADIFAHVPLRYSHLRALLDARSESGQESVLRMILTEAGLRFESQVRFPGVGRVDFVVEGRLVLEADSRLAHDGWELHVRDRNRDLNLAIQGYMSLRPTYQRIIHTPSDVLAAVRGLLAGRQNVIR